MNPIRNILRSALRTEDDRLNILVITFDGQFEQMLGKTGHNFYCVPELSKIRWSPQLVTLPDNVKMLKSVNNLGLRIDYDLVLCNSRIEQYGLASQISNVLHIPMIIVEHFHPQNVWRLEDIEIIKTSQRQNLHVSATDSIGHFWNIGGRIINYGVELPDAQPIDQGSVLLCGDFPIQDQKILFEMLKGVPKAKIIGNNPGVSLPIVDTELDKYYAGADIYVNVSTATNLPISLLKAMAAGCAIISNDVFVLQDALEPGKNALIAKTIPEFKAHISRLQNNKTVARQMGQRSREIIQEKFGLSRFISEWGSALDDVGSIVFTK